MTWGWQRAFPARYPEGALRVRVAESRGSVTDRPVRPLSPSAGRELGHFQDVHAPASDFTMVWTSERLNGFKRLYLTV